MSTVISYGKSHVVFFRLGGDGVAPLAAAVDVDVFGERFISAYTKGDNREVVATDTMKNFVYAMAAEYTGRTLLGLCAFFGRKLLATYPVMEALQVSAREVPLDAASGERGPSDVLFRLTRGDVAVAEVSLQAGSSGPEITRARSGWEGMVLLKTTGSSFASFARDDYTTLPDLVDRPLTIRLDAHWRYGDLRDGVAERYVRGRNAAASPYRFELELDDPEVWFAEDDGYELAVFHSHPETEPRPSRTDQELSGLWGGRTFVIYGVARDELRAWKISRDSVEELDLA